MGDTHSDTHGDTADAFFDDDDDFSDDAFTDDDFSDNSFSDNDFSDNAFTGSAFSYDDAVSAFSDDEFSDDEFTDDDTEHAFTDDGTPTDDTNKRIFSDDTPTFSDDMSSDGYKVIKRSKDASSKAVVYARTGTNSTESNGTDTNGTTEPSIELQFEAATAHARMAGYTQVERVSDEATPDDELPFSRPGLRSALMALASGEASALAVSGIGRISLNMDIVTLVFDCAQNDGWRLIVPGFTVTDDAPTGRFILNMLCEATKLNKAKTQAPLQQQAPQATQPLENRPVSPQQSHQPPQMRTATPASRQAAPPVTSYTSHTNTTPVVANALRYLTVWQRAITEHENGFSHQEIAASFNTENIALPQDPRYANTKTWTANIVKNLTDWPEGVRLLDRAIAEYESGQTFEQIAADLNIDGMHTSTGKQWTARSLAGLLNS